MLPARAATRQPDHAREPVAQIDGRLVLAYTPPITRGGFLPATAELTATGLPTDRERPSALGDAAG
jgi:hypothetical protein